MKNLLTALLLLFIINNSFAQVPPQAFNYSAVARNPQGNPIANTTIAIQIGILKGTLSGQLQYLENHIVLTDAFGLFNLTIGGGAIQQGTMSAISWGTDNYFIQIGMDATGGSNFITMGTTQLLSVPYALHAGTASSLSAGHYIGELYGGGIIFHLFRDSVGVEHGLIVSLADQSSGTAWEATAACLSGSCVNVSHSESTWDGRANTDAIIAFLGTNPSAANFCAAYNGAGFNDWYLPSIQELSLLWKSLYDVNKKLSSTSGGVEILQNIYWSSTEVDAIGAWFFSYLTGTVAYYDKVTSYRVRAIRAF